LQPGGDAPGQWRTLPGSGGRTRTDGPVRWGSDRPGGTATAPRRETPSGVAAAAAAGVDAIDTIHPDFEDEEGLREDARFARRIGFDGKFAIHPAQVDPINDAFAPDPEEVEWARRVLAAREEHDGEGVFRVGGEMIDAPLIARAERTVALAEEIEDV
jgi:citrate lyase beta subunit